MNHPEKEIISPLRAGLSCKCPQCGKGKLYDGFLTIHKNCSECGLDYSPFDSGDGPAVFVILFLGFIVVGLALVVEVKFSPPLWVQMALWIPTIIGSSLAMLRPAKALMMAAQYHFKAEEGKLDQ